MTRTPSPGSRVPVDRVLTGWGRTVATAAHVVPVNSREDVHSAVVSSGSRGVLARGLGRSYGDAGQSGGGTVLDLSRMSRVTLDVEAATVTAEAGGSLDALMRQLIPAGFFVPVTPGTRMVTIGGAVAADVHGKNNHLEGTFGSHVSALTVVDGQGAVRDLSPADTPREFWATIGGMGLTGVITQATFDLIPITSAQMLVDTERYADLDSLMGRMAVSDESYRYSVAWIDSLVSSYRGILMQGDHAPAEALSPRLRASPLKYSPRALATAPKRLPGFLLNRVTMQTFNEVWFRKAPKSARGQIQSIPAFFHPLDAVNEWSRIYGRRGFVQYQFAIPDSGSDVIRRSLDHLRMAGIPTFLTLLKRFGDANPAPLSFPRPGWTLATDIPADSPGLGAALDELDDMVLREGGRFYLAKDSRMSAATAEASYPRLREWRQTRDDMDPKGVFVSDLSRRLELC